MGDAVMVEKEDPRQFVLLEDVKPDDTEGVKLTGTAPNSKELQTALENSTRDELVEAVRLKVKKLPLRIYNEARSKEQEENADGAAEDYLRFLSCTLDDGSTEREHAKSFLAQQFNMRPTASVSQ
jgi:aminopeptidase N